MPDNEQLHYPALVLLSVDTALRQVLSKYSHLCQYVMPATKSATSIYRTGNISEILLQS